MFKLDDRVIETRGVKARGVVIDLDDCIDKPYGVLFEDVDDDKGVWWCDSDMIKKDDDSDYDVDQFVKEIYDRKPAWEE